MRSPFDESPHLSPHSDTGNDSAICTQKNDKNSFIWFTKKMKTK